MIFCFSCVVVMYDCLLLIVGYVVHGVMFSWWSDKKGAWWDARSMDKIGTTNLISFLSPNQLPRQLYFLNIFSSNQRCRCRHLNTSWRSLSTRWCWSPCTNDERFPQIRWPFFHLYWLHSRFWHANGATVLRRKWRGSIHWHLLRQSACGTEHVLRWTQRWNVRFFPVL